MKKSIYIVAILLFTSCFLYSYYHIYYTKTQNKEIILIPKGMGLISISQSLENKEVISNKWIFILLTKVFRAKIIAGEYLFEKDSSTIEVLKKLISGEVVVHKILVPEGYTVKEAVHTIQNSYGVVSTNLKIKDWQEGSLLPDTYFYKYGVQDTDLLKQMQSSMSQFIQGFWGKRKAVNKIMSPIDAITLASIVEREAIIDSERPIIASVYINRLNLDMRLQADPTVVYGLNQLYSYQLRQNDLKKPSKYNTYINFGLPPTPICNPGKSSILAALFPAQTNYIYFVADCNGGHKFSKTFVEHKAYVKQLRECR